MKFKVAERFKALRELRRLNQEQVAAHLGLNDRQSVAHIETGRRQLTPGELVKAATLFGVTLQEFANPFLLPAGARFSWRQANVPTSALRAFQDRAGEWLGAYKELGDLAGEPRQVLTRRLQLTYRSSFEEATAAGERVAAELKLGAIPAKRLAHVMESELGILVLMVDAIDGVSGAACTLPSMNAMIVNRNDAASRRNFDLAHELFHLLTWDAMPPEWADGEARDGAGGSGTRASRIKRIERLADSFASGLLMPGPTLDALGVPGDDLVSWLNAAAWKLGVSSTALKWQLVNTGRISRESGSITDAMFRDGRRRHGPTPPLFSRRFVERLVAGISLGHVSASKAAALTDLDIDGLGELCVAHGLPRPVELGGEMAS